jgi:membrane protein
MGKALRGLGRLIKRLFRPLAPFGRLLKAAVMGFMTHNVSRMAASIAYFGAFSLAPILVIAVTLASLVFGKAASEGLVLDRLSETFGESHARFIQSMLAGIYNNSGGLTVATVLAILLLMWASTRIIGATRGALNDIWGVPGHGGTGFLGFVFGKLIDLGFVLVIGVMFLAAMLANTAVSALTGYFSDILPMPGWVLQLIGIVFSLLVTTIFLTIIFRYLPNIKVRFVYILMGASVTAVLFSIGNYVIGRYLGRTSPGSTFGAAGSLAVILIWMYYAANIVLFGAEVTRAYALRGKLRTAPEGEGQCGFDGASDEGAASARPAAFEGIPSEARDDLPEELGETRPNRPA